MEKGLGNDEKKVPSVTEIRQERAQEAYVSDWGIDKYRKVLGDDFMEMRGKLGLDIGSGRSEKFSKEGAKIGLKIISMAPYLKDGMPRLEDGEIDPTFLQDWQKLSVGGIAQEIPFTDNTFDYEVGLFSVPYYLPLASEEYEVFFKEVLRTLKPGGNAYLAPVFKNKEKGEGFVSAEFISEVLGRFSDSMTYKIEPLNAGDQECRLILYKT